MEEKHKRLIVISWIVIIRIRIIVIVEITIIIMEILIDRAFKGRVALTMRCENEREGCMYWVVRIYIFTKLG